jgi:hypothetical protein
MESIRIKLKDGPCKGRIVSLPICNGVPKSFVRVAEHKPLPSLPEDAITAISTIESYVYETVLWRHGDTDTFDLKYVKT